jgi:transcriptional regulator with XRE-family HTH domain
MAATEFGQAVRRWRERISPEAAGLPVGGHRRAAGLRHEKLAMLAGISVDYVTRLEQGRTASPSAQVVEALARALRLLGTTRPPSARSSTISRWGTLTLDCDVLTVKGSGLHITIYTAEPGTEDAERLALLIVLGTQTIVG